MKDVHKPTAKAAAKILATPAAHPIAAARFAIEPGVTDTIGGPVEVACVPFPTPLPVASGALPPVEYG